MNSIQEQIRWRAYLYYVERGYVSGHEQEDWLRAEKEIAASSIETPLGPPEAVNDNPTEESGFAGSKKAMGKSRAKKHQPVYQ